MKLLIATHNAHKLAEFRQILSPLGYQVVGADDVGLSDCAETGQTFRENSYQKALHAVQETGLTALADDSGLCVDALNGRPGVFSARYAAQNGGYPAVFQVLFNELKNAPDWSAHFHCCLCLLSPGHDPVYFEGDVPGTLTTRMDDSMEKFGYDPIFIPSGYDRPFGGLSASVKEHLSHRAKALEKLRLYLDNGKKIR